MVKQKYIERVNRPFDFSKLPENITTKQYIEVGCLNCHKFFKVRCDALYNQGCPYCSSTGRPKTSLADFISKARKIHPLYCYALTSFKNLNDTIKIICPTHGVFEVKASNHLYRKQGCPVCRKENQKMDIQDWIDQARQVHNSIYTYIFNTDKIYKQDKVEVFCHSCNSIFLTDYRTHITRKANCPTCVAKKRGNDRIIPFDNIQKNNRLIYYKKTYVDANTSMLLQCKHCKIFFYNSPRNAKTQGCPACGIRKRTKKLSFSKDEIIASLENKFDIKVINYVSKNNILVKCNKCGREYTVTHKYVPVCECQRDSHKTENRVVRCFEKYTRVKHEKTFTSLKNEKELRIDVYLLDYDIAVEVQGPQHFYPVRFGNQTQEDAEKAFIIQQENDAIKRKWCEEHHIPLFTEVVERLRSDKQVEDFVKSVLKQTKVS